jgi:hypothetical protein
MEFLECYEFYAPSQAHCFLEREEREIEFQRIHILPPNNPFYDYNSHLLVDIQVVCTIGLKYTL